MRWMWGTGTPPPPLADRDYACALAAVVEWYHRQRDVIAALDEWHARHLAWYEATTPGQPLTNPKAFDQAHYEMAAAWQRVVKALEARDRATHPNPSPAPPRAPEAPRRDP